jgi:hypothetical protein
MLGQTLTVNSANIVAVTHRDGLIRSRISVAVGVLLLHRWWVDDNIGFMVSSKVGGREMHRRWLVVLGASAVGRRDSRCCENFEICVLVVS